MWKALEMPKRAVGVVVVAALLGGCATAAQREYQAITSNTRSAAQNFQSCTLAVYNSPELEPLRRHIPGNVGDVTLEQLSDRSLATDDEIQLILIIHPQTQSCRKQELDQISLTTPTLVPIILATVNKNESSLVDLIQKKQSWGDHVRRVKEAYIEGNAELVEESRRIEAGLQQSHEAELARRQAAASAFAQYMQTQQLINNMNRPVITNCMNLGGGMVNCTSQ